MIVFLCKQECCYTRWGSLVNSHDGRGGHTFYFHPRWQKQHFKYDVEPKHWCCDFSDNCELFYSVRPTDYCYGYMPLFIGTLLILHALYLCIVYCKKYLLIQSSTIEWWLLTMQLRRQYFISFRCMMLIRGKSYLLRHHLC